MFDATKLEHWNPAKSWLKIKTIDAHTAGEPLRIIYEGFPELKGKSILERRRDAKQNYDLIRKALMWEPRGHADMYGCILTPAISESADFGVLFTHNEGYSSMCGHGIIAVTKVLVETGAIQIHFPETKVKIDTPAGLVTAYAIIENEKVQSVRFENVPSFVFKKDLKTEVTGIGTIYYDIAFGGAFYAFVDADELGIEMTEKNYRGLIETGMAIKNQVMQEQNIEHPFEQDLNFLYGTIFTGKAHSKNADSRNVCIFAEGEVDRSPTGTGVSARMALHHAKGDLAKGESMIIESIIGSKFTGKVAEITRFGKYDAVVPEVRGEAFITAKNEFLIDPDDPLKEGFILR